ncbi:MAG: hypothetical protein KJ698_11745, partial [Actinobacteria bacterium]|nr:hypothetical protein [Actinomycetota bacterium]
MGFRRVPSTHAPQPVSVVILAHPPRLSETATSTPLRMRRSGSRAALGSALAGSPESGMVWVGFQLAS